MNGKKGANTTSATPTNARPNAPRNVKVTWLGNTGTMAAWTGPDTPDGGSHLAFGISDVRVKCPCGWSHRVHGDGTVVSVRMVAPPVETPTRRVPGCGGAVRVKGLRLDAKARAALGRVMLWQDEYFSPAKVQSALYEWLTNGKVEDLSDLWNVRPSPTTGSRRGSSDRVPYEVREFLEALGVPAPSSKLAEHVETATGTVA